MSSSGSRRYLLPFLLAWPLGGAACSGAPDAADLGDAVGGEGDGVVKQAILNGVAVDETNSGVVLLSNGCTGTLLTNQFVLTASHCVDLHIDRDFTLAGMDGMTAGTRDGVFVDAAVVDSSGRLIIGGMASNQFYLMRFTATGERDASFGTNGEVLTDFVSSSNEAIMDLAVQSDGRIVAAGWARDAGNDFKFLFALARYNTNGSLDTTYNHDGKVLTDFESSTGAQANGLVIDTSGRAVVAGSAVIGVANQFALARYRTDGELDTTFNFDGKVLTDFASQFEETAEDVALDSSGRIVAGGWSRDGSIYSVAGARYTTAGALDTSFNHDGKILLTDTTDVGATSVLTQGSKVLLGGHRGDRAGVWRFGSDGALDTTFGVDGLSSPNVVAGTMSVTADEVVDMKFASDGRIRLALTAEASAASWVFSYATIGANGERTADRLFPQGHARVILASSSSAFRPNAMATSGSRVFLVGERQTLATGARRSVVQVLQPDRTQDLTFNAALSVEMDGDSIGADRAFLSSSNDDVAILRLERGMEMNGSPDGFEFAGFLSDFATLAGKDVTCRGYGANAFDANGQPIGFGTTLRQGASRVIDVESLYVTLGFRPAPATEQIPLPGDSGGSCTSGGKSIGVLSKGNDEMTEAVRASRFAAWATGVAGL